VQVAKGVARRNTRSVTNSAPLLPTVATGVSGVNTLAPDGLGVISGLIGPHRGLTMLVGPAVLPAGV